MESLKYKVKLFYISYIIKFRFNYSVCSIWKLSKRLKNFMNQEDNRLKRLKNKKGFQNSNKLMMNRQDWKY